MFSAKDRTDYPIKLGVHEKCNHKWHIEDEKLSIFFDVLHGGKKANDPKHVRKLRFVEIHNDQGKYQGLTNFPIRPLTQRIIRCAHALMYREFLPTNTPGHIHYPIPEADPNNNNAPFPVLEQTYAFSSQLCMAQKAGTFDSVIAYNGKFRYVCTWTTTDNGEPICIFSYDVYRLANFAVKIEHYPSAVIGYYGAQRPLDGTKCTELIVESSIDEILYPILQH